jgi:hypothetical protein
LDNFKFNLKLPGAGRLSEESGLIVDKSLGQGRYWSSSPNDWSAYALGFGEVYVIPQYSLHRARSFSVRCFKN